MSTDEFISVMITNALSPMRVVETLQDLVLPSGTIGIMTSGQGSITNTTDAQAGQAGLQYLDYLGREVPW